MPFSRRIRSLVIPAIVACVSPIVVCAQSAPTINSFTATPATIVDGDTSRLSWTTSNASTATISDGSVTVTVAVSGSLSVAPTSTTTYTLTARNSGGASATKTVKVTVTTVPAPQILSFTANPPSISQGQSSTLSWTTRDATTVRIDQGLGTQAVNGSVPVQPAATTTYKLTASNSSGSKTESVTVTVASFDRLLLLVPGETHAPGTATGKAGRPGPQTSGESFTVTVLAVDAAGNLATSATDQVSITSSDGAADLPAAGALIEGTRTFTVTLNTAGNATLTASDVTDPSKTPGSGSIVVRPPQAPSIAVGVFPTGMITTPGGATATDRYSLVNTGPTNAQITLSQSGDFFSQSPQVFTLAPGASQFITLTAEARPPGSYEGTSMPAGEGVPPELSIPVKLLSSAPPSGKPSVRALAVRVDTNERAGSGSVRFRNTGNADAVGILVSDVPWTIPERGVVTIRPGEIRTVTFTIDRTKRPDAAAAIGSQIGLLKFVYIGDGTNVQAFSRDPFGSSGSNQTASVVLVDTVGAGSVVPWSIPAYGPGETGRFLLGLTTSSQMITDVSIVQIGLTPLNNLKLYFVPSGVQSSNAQAASINGLVSNVPFGMGDVVRSVFLRRDLSGSVQFRTSSSRPLAVGAVVLHQRERETFGTALAHFRSDSASAAGEDIFLVGVRSDGQTRTDIYLQETSRATASIQLEFLDATGARVGSLRTVNLPEFGQVELLDAVPSGAVAVRITHRSGSDGRIVAEARVVETDGDVWNVVDGSRQQRFPRSERVIIPYAANGPGTRTDLAITNPGDSPATAQIEWNVSGSRRRAVGRTGAHDSQRFDPELSAWSNGMTLTVGPHETKLLDDVLGTSVAATTTRGYLRVTPTSGEVVVSSRTHGQAVTGGASAGTSVPALAVSTALRSGAAKSIAGFSDASIESIAERRPGTYRSALGLVEAAGGRVSVHATLRYNYILGLTTARVAADRTFELGPNQFLLIDELSRTMLGPSRDVVGDLHNLQLDIEVTGGNGAVIPFVLSTENATGDLIFRTD